MKKYMFFKITSIRPGITIGALVSILFGSVYIVVLHEPGSAFCLFAGLTFLGGSLIGGIVSAVKAQAQRQKAFLTASSVIFGMVSILFIFTYAVLPQFARTNVQLPAFCDGLDGSYNPPPFLILHPARWKHRNLDHQRYRIDNYGGLSETYRPLISRASSGHWYMETTAVISSWHIDGRVISRPHLTFNGIARGCFISGDSGEVMPY
jgi:hypothetical protein